MLICVYTTRTIGHGITEVNIRIISGQVLPRFCPRENFVILKLMIGFVLGLGNLYLLGPRALSYGVRSLIS